MHAALRTRAYRGERRKSVKTVCSCAQLMRKLFEINPITVDESSSRQQRSHNIIGDVHLTRCISSTFWTARIGSELPIHINSQRWTPRGGEEASRFIRMLLQHQLGSLFPLVSIPDLQPAKVCCCLCHLGGSLDPHPSPTLLCGDEWMNDQLLGASIQGFPATGVPHRLGP